MLRLTVVALGFIAVAFATPAPIAVSLAPISISTTNQVTVAPISSGAPAGSKKSAKGGNKGTKQTKAPTAAPLTNSTVRPKGSKKGGKKTRHPTSAPIIVTPSPTVATPAPTASPVSEKKGGQKKTKKKA